MILTSLCILCPFHPNSVLILLLVVTNTFIKQEPLLSPRALHPLMPPLDPVTPASLVRTTVVVAEVDTAPSTPTSASLLVVAPSSDAFSLFSFQIQLRFFHVFFKSFFFFT